METRANYLIVGSFVLALVAGVVLFVIWLSAAPSPRQTKIYHVDFHDAVTGLQEGARVLYRGIPVGSVKNIRVDPEDVEEIQVTIEVGADTPVRSDTVASLGFQGLTFVAFVQLEGGTQAAPPLQPKPGRKIATIHSRSSPIQRVFNSAPELLDRVNHLVDRAGALLSDQNLRNFDDSIANVHALTASLASKGPQLAAIIDDSATLVRSLDTLAKHLDSEGGQLTGELKPTLAELRKAGASIGALATSLNEVVEENRRPLRDFSGQGLYELTQFFAEARIAVESLTRLTNKIEQDPTKFLLGNPQQQGVRAR